MIKFDLNNINPSVDWASKNIEVSSWGGEGYLDSLTTKVESSVNIIFKNKSAPSPSDGAIEMHISTKLGNAPINIDDYSYKEMGVTSTYCIVDNEGNKYYRNNDSVTITAKSNQMAYIWYATSDIVANNYLSTYEYNGTVVEMQPNKIYQQYLSGTSPLILTSYYLYVCLSPNTKILMADNTEKEIYKLSKDDKILSYNPATMKIEEDEITYTDSQETKVAGSYDIYTFDNGTKIETINRHRFYNYEQQKMVYMDEWLIGDHAVTKDGKLTKLISHMYVPQKTRHYTLFTKNQNYFANGLLSGNRNTKELKISI